jgi:hypothetical protein
MKAGSGTAGRTYMHVDDDDDDGEESGSDSANHSDSDDIGDDMM